MAQTFKDGAHHCAMFPVDAHGASRRAFQRCKLNPRHEKFMRIDEFMEKDPSEINVEEDDMPKVLNIIDRTVRIVVSHTSADRPDTYINTNNPYPCQALRGNNQWIRTGTGFVSSSTVVNGEEETCPCPVCKKSTSDEPKKERYYFGVATATHVVFDTKEARSAVFELFYDSEDRKRVECLYGIISPYSLAKVQTDRCFVLCLTHDSGLAERLQKMCYSPPGFPCNLLVSHPHGVSKRISLGKFIHQQYFLINESGSMKLKKGMKVRFPDCEDTVRTIEFINSCLKDHEPVIGFIDDDEHQTPRLLCDLCINYPAEVYLEYAMEGAFSAKKFTENMWLRLPPGIELATDDGHCGQIPCDTVLELSANETLFHYNFPKIFGSEARLYTASTYDIASCPGSSGAGVFFRDGPTAPESCVRDTVHFGCLGDHNISGLDDGWIFQLLFA